MDKFHEKYTAYKIWHKMKQKLRAALYLLKKKITPVFYKLRK